MRRLQRLWHRWFGHGLCIFRAPAEQRPGSLSLEIWCVICGMHLATHSWDYSVLRLWREGWKR